MAGKATDKAVEVEGLSHKYGQRAALDGIDVSIEKGEAFAFLGPNGGGKTTLFRVLSTLIPMQSGRVALMGWNLPQQEAEVRKRLGVVFQAPSLDKKLTVRENLRHQGWLYGLSGATLEQRVKELTEWFRIDDRLGSLVETLSGGLRRRVELAKGMLHRPALLLLDEPSTGLDPGARSDLWEQLLKLKREQGVTVVLTTHLLEEAEKVDRLAILNEGRIAAMGRPAELRSEVGGDSITILADDPQAAADVVARDFPFRPTIIDGAVRLNTPNGHEWIARLVEALPGQVRSITVGRPTLEDVFIAHTGRRLWSEAAA